VTIDERFERIEHVTAGLAEENRKNQEENRQLWRDTQRQIDALAATVRQFAEESRAADERLREEMREMNAKTDQRFRETDERFRRTDERVGDIDERINRLVGAIGEMLRGNPKKN
jgi:DNA anti-recombination protein RmuC